MSRECCVNELRSFARWISALPDTAPSPQAIGMALTERAHFLEHLGTCEDFVPGTIINNVPLDQMDFSVRAYRALQGA